MSEAPSPTFIHLRLHTEYSLIDGLTDVKALVKRCAKLGMPAVAITDHSNLFALVKFYKAAQGGGIKPIAGADVLVYNDAEPASPYLLSLYVQNETGYRTLTELISRAYRENQHQGVPQVMAEWLETTNQGLIALSGARQGQIGRAILAGNKDEARRVLGHWLGVFGDRFYLELQRTGRPHEEAYIEGAVELALEFDAPVVATNDVRFLDPTDFEAHEARVCIHQGRVLDDPRRPRDYTDQQYLKSPQEMAALFADLPEALENTVEIAKRCTLKMTLGKNYLPKFPVPEGMTTAEFFAEESRKGLRERLAVRAPTGKGTLEERTQAYWDRLELEIGVINQMDFPGYFLIVADFIQWAKNNGIPVGPGRGSGAGSLVAYALKITDLDPIEFDLLFERFLNPERVSMPDFDVDFCMDRRDEVIAYVADKYGRDQVSQIITYGSMAAKAVVRDVGRVLGHPYGFVDRIAKLIPFELGMTLEKALTDSEDLKKLYDTDEEVKALIDLAMSLEGLTRNAGKHAGGVVIAPSELIDFSPLYCEQGGDNLVTQFDKDDVEAVGLVKFDFLGLRTLTIIDWALEAINKSLAEQGKPPVDIAQIPLDDPPTYELLKNCQTTAVFQLESRGMKDLIKRLRPDSFEDIVALVALFRPGPLQSGMVDDYINVKHGKQQAEYAHPILEPILKPTNGVILYQEQVMRIAQDMAGYTLGGADLLRRCLSGSTRVMDVASGRLVTLAEIAENPNQWLGREVFSLNFDTLKIEPRPITAIYPNGVRDIFTLTTATGRSIRATADHLFYALDGWKPVAAFAPGDTLALAANLPIQHGSEISDAQIKLIAYLLGDGHLSTKKPSNSYFCNSDPALIEDFNRCAETLFGSPAPVDHQLHPGRQTATYARIGFVSAFNRWVDNHVKRAHSRDKEIPDWVFTLSASQLSLFLGTLWSTDGSFDTLVGHTDYTSTSETLIRQLQHLLLRLGITALFNIKTITYRNNPHISYRVQITGREDMLKFQTKVGPYLSAAKGRMAEVCYAKIAGKGYNQSKHQLPPAIVPVIAEAKRVSGMTWAEIDAAVGSRPGGMSSGLNFQQPPTRSLSRQRVRRFAEAFGDSKLHALADSEILWDRIVSIEYSGKDEVFDLTIDHNHNFVADEFIAHNCMGKKKPEEMAQQRGTFVSGAEKNGVKTDVANFIFDLVDKFSGYGFNKCITGNALISEANTGEQITVETLFKTPREFAIHALDDTGKLRARRVSDVVWNGPKPVFELTTALGKRITATANHPFRTLSGWTNLENLQIGDRIAVPRILQATTSNTWPRHWLITLAGLLSEGNTCHPTYLYFYGNEWTLVKDFATAVEYFPNSVARIYPRSNNRIEVCVSTGQDRRFKAGQIPWNARPAVNGSLALAVEPDLPSRSGAFLWAQSLDLLGRKAPQKRIPAPIFELCDADLELFLGRLWAGDGFIASKTQAIPPFYATSSRELADGVQHLLLRLGIVSRVESKQFKYRGGLRPGYAVWLLGEGMVDTFVRRIIPHIIGRDSQIEILRQRLALIQPGRSSKDTIPIEIRAWIAADRERLGLSWRALADAAELSVTVISNEPQPNRQGFRRATISRLGKALQSQRLSDLAESDIFWDRVVSIEPKGVMETYDLTVEEDHNFVANGIIVHNSHSAAYALVSYQTAWLKAHFPSAFMAAVLSSDMDKTDKVVVFIEECRQMKIAIRPPDINRSEFRFTALPDGSIQYGLGAIKGVGENAITDILDERRKNGPYADLYDLCKRIDLRKANRRVLEALIKGGALDAIDANRARFIAELPDALKAAEQHGAMEETGQDDLFGLMQPAGVAEEKPRAFVAAEPWSEAERLEHEKNTLGLYLTGHPISPYEDEIRQFVTDRLGSLSEKYDQSNLGGGGFGRRGNEVKVVVAGLVVELRAKQNKNGKRMGFATLDDRTGRLEVAVFSEAFEKYRDYLVKDTLLVVEGNLSFDDFAGQLRLSAERLMSIEQARAHFAKHLTIRWPEGQTAPMADMLREVLTPFRGGPCPIFIEYRGKGAESRLLLGEAWRVRPGEELLERLGKSVGAERVKLIYQ